MALNTRCHSPGAPCNDRRHARSASGRSCSIPTWSWCSPSRSCCSTAPSRVVPRPEAGRDQPRGGARMTVLGRRAACRDCGRLEGRLHEPSCSQEVCPTCGGQAVVCECNRQHFPRVPFVRWGNVCARCGLLDPGLFMVPDQVWQHYIEPRQRACIVCFGCWREITRLIDRGRYATRHGNDAHGLAEGVWWVFGPPDEARIGPRPRPSRR